MKSFTLGHTTIKWLSSTLPASSYYVLLPISCVRWQARHQEIKDKWPFGNSWSNGKQLETRFLAIYGLGGESKNMVLPKQILVDVPASSLLLTIFARTHYLVFPVLPLGLPCAFVGKMIENFEYQFNLEWSQFYFTLKWSVTGCWLWGF